MIIRVKFKTKECLVFESLDEKGEISGAMMSIHQKSGGIYHINLNEVIYIDVSDETQGKEEDDGMIYCIEIHRELKDVYVMHKKFPSEPSRKEVLEVIKAEDIGYNDDYGQFAYWPVVESGLTE